MPASIASRPTPWKSLVLLCGKCARKLDGGFGPKGRDTLRSTMRQALKDSGRRRDVRIIETRCMGLCPKNAVTMVGSGDPGRIYAVPVGTQPEDALRLVGDPAPRD
jgi:predicted metal-binding protein